MTAMRISVRSPVLHHKSLRSLYSLVEALKPMTNQSLTIRMRRPLNQLLTLYQTVEASTG